MREHQAVPATSRAAVPAALGEGPPDAGQDVDGEGERGDVEADRIDGEVGEREPEPGDGQRDRDRERDAEPGPRRELVRGRSRRDEQREHEQRARDLARLRDREAEDEQEPEAEQSHRHTGRAGDVRVDGGEEQRPGRDGDERDSGERDGKEHGHLLLRDAEEGAEEQRVEPVEDAVVEADEEEAERERERLQRADRGRLRAEAAPRAGDARERQRADPAEAEVARSDGQAGEACGGGAGKGDHRERVPGERLAAQDHEPAGDAGHDRDDRARLERVDHERVREQSGARRSTTFQDSPWKIGGLNMGMAVAVDERRFRLADDDEAAVGGPQHLDRRAVEAAERRARDHFLRTALDGARRRRDRRPGRGSRGSG